MTTEVKVEEKQPEAPAYGFDVRVGKNGEMSLTPHNLTNDFEFIGLIELLNQKKNDMLKAVGFSLEARTLQSVGLLAKVLGGLIQAEPPKADAPQAG